MPSLRAERAKKGIFLVGHVVERHRTFCGHLLGAYGNLYGDVHEFVGQFHHPPVECGGKQHVLPLVEGRKTTQDEPQIVDETHVEHPVRLVDDQRLDFFQVVHVLLQVVYQSPGGADNDIGTFLRAFLCFM
jgi:hypothetical protein